MFATKASIDAIDGFDTSYLRMQDIEFIFRFNMKFRVCSIKDRLIIKCVNYRPVKVNSYRKHEAVLNKFIEQFRNEIIQLIGSEEADKWLESQAAHLFRIAVGEGEKNCIKDATERLKKYRRLTPMEHLKIIFPDIWIWIKNNQKFVELKNNRDNKTYELEKLLTMEERSEFERFKKKYLLDNK